MSKNIKKNPFFIEIKRKKTIFYYIYNRYVLHEIPY